MLLKADLKKRSWPRTALVTRPNCWKWSRMASTGEQSGTADARTAVIESPGAQPYTKALSQATQIFEKEVILLFHGEVSFDGAQINEESIFIESWKVVERRLMDWAGRGVRKASSKAATTTAKRFSIRSHFPRKDRGKTTTRMNVVYEDLAEESLSRAMEYTERRFTYKCAQERV